MATKEQWENDQWDDTVGQFGALPMLPAAGGVQRSAAQQKALVDRANADRALVGLPPLPEPAKHEGWLVKLAHKIEKALHIQPKGHTTGSTSGMHGVPAPKAKEWWEDQFDSTDWSR